MRAALGWYPRRRVALAARLPVAPDRPGGAVRRTDGRGRGRAWLARARRAARARPDAPLLSARAALRAVLEVVRVGVPAARGGSGSGASPRTRRRGRPSLPRGRKALVEAVEAVARRHNAVGITEEVEPTVRFFYARPFRVLGSGRFVDACLAEVSDPWLRSLPLVGAIDQLSDSTDVLSDPARSRRLRRCTASRLECRERRRASRALGRRRPGRRSTTFPSPGEPIPAPVARWLGRIKAAAARVNAELGLLDEDKAERIAGRRRPHRARASSTTSSRSTSSRPARAPRRT